MGSNLAIPFWVVGHIHLSLNIYKDIYEILGFLWYEYISFVGLFWFEWKKEKKKEN